MKISGENFNFFIEDKSNFGNNFPDKWDNTEIRKMDWPASSTYVDSLPTIRVSFQEGDFRTHFEFN